MCSSRSNRKLEERRKFLEPQVLRIGDDDDYLENDLEVDESDEDNASDKQTRYFSPGDILRTLFYNSRIDRLSMFNND
jgi:hypothetical protein